MEVILKRLLLPLFFISLAVSPSFANEAFKEGGEKVGEGFKKIGKNTGQAFKEGGQKVGQGFKEIGKETAKESKKAGRTVGEWFKDMGRSFKEFFKGGKK